MKIAGKHAANTEMKFVTHVETAEAPLEAEQAAVRQIVSFVRKDGMQDASIVVKQDAALTVTAESIAVIM